LLSFSIALHDSLHSIYGQVLRSKVSFPKNVFPMFLFCEKRSPFLNYTKREKTAFNVYLHSFPPRNWLDCFVEYLVVMQLISSTELIGMVGANPARASEQQVQIAPNDLTKRHRKLFVRTSGAHHAKARKTLNTNRLSPGLGSRLRNIRTGFAGVRAGYVAGRASEWLLGRFLARARHAHSTA
jgi:hypothetical protein